jgi:hypothetical protein
MHIIMHSNQDWSSTNKQSGATYFLRRREQEIMPTKLNKRALEHAKNLISKGKCIQDEKDKWTNLHKMKTSS